MSYSVADFKLIPKKLNKSLTLTDFHLQGVALFFYSGLYTGIPLLFPSAQRVYWQTGVSKRTLLEFNPVVQDVDMEEERIKEEQKENQQNELFNFAERTNIENDGEFEPEEPEEKGEQEKVDKTEWPL